MTPKRPERMSPAQAYQLEITLADSKPPIWRRLRVIDDTSLHTLHLIIQRALGWTNSHLYQFEVADRRFSEPDPEDDYSEEPPEDAERTRLHDLDLRQGNELTYVYDFGDWWEHRILVEAIFAPLADESYPSCIGGARVGPPDDSGGVRGYAELIAALRNPSHPEHVPWSEWVPADFDPEAFDPVETTRLLQLFHGKKHRGIVRKLHARKTRPKSRR